MPTDSERLDTLQRILWTVHDVVLFGPNSNAPDREQPWSALIFTPGKPPIYTPGTLTLRAALDAAIEYHARALIDEDITAAAKREREAGL